MKYSAEWLRGAIEALNRAQRDFTVTVPELQAEYVALLADAEDREAFPIPDTLPKVPEAREASQPTATEVIAACEKHISDTLEGMPDKIDPRMKYREFQYHDYELDEMRSLLSSIARWKEANGGTTAR